LLPDFSFVAMWGNMSHGAGEQQPLLELLGMTGLERVG